MSAPSPTGHKALALLGTAAVLTAAVYLSSDPAPVAATPAPAIEQAGDATAQAVAAATTFLAALEPKQKEQAALDYASDKKPNWSNLPVTFVPRNGVRLGDLTKDQRARAMAVVASCFSLAVSVVTRISSADAL